MREIATRVLSAVAVDKGWLGPLGRDKTKWQEEVGISYM